MPTLADIRAQYPQYNDMSDQALSDALYKKFYSDMPRATFDQKLGIASAPQPSLSDAVTDIPAEIARTAGANLDTIKEGFLGDKADQGVIGGMLATGKALAAIPGLLASPVTGAVRSLIGHPLAQATHAAGEVINPAVAGKDDPQALYRMAADQAETALSAAAPRGFNPTGAVPIVPKAPAPSAGDISAAAKQGFDAVTRSNAAVRPDAVKTLAANIAGDLQAKGLRVRAAPETHDILSELQQPPQSAVATIADIHEARQALGQAAKSADPRERLAAVTAQNHLDDYLSNIPASDVVSGDPAAIAKTLKDAMGNYAAVRRAETVQGKLDTADLNTAAANSGQNIDNATRQQIKSILNNPKARRGFSREELAAMEKLVRGSAAGNVLRGVGNMLGGGGGLGAIISAGTGAYAAGPVGAAAPMIGYGVKKLGNLLTARQAASLDELIRSRSPLAASMAPVPYIHGFGVPGTATMGGFLSGTAPRALFPFLAGPIPTYADQNQ